jgi:predicted RNase H-like HicB family nuclease
MPIDFFDLTANDGAGGIEPHSVWSVMLTAQQLEPVGRSGVCGMSVQFTLEYWQDDGWYVGRLKEWPAVCSQGETLADLEENLRDAYQLMLETEDEDLPADVQSKTFVVAT